MKIVHIQETVNHAFSIKLRKRDFKAAKYIRIRPRQKLKVCVCVGRGGGGGG